MMTASDKAKFKRMLENQGLQNMGDKVTDIKK